MVQWESLVRKKFGKFILLSIQQMNISAKFITKFRRFLVYWTICQNCQTYPPPMLSAIRYAVTVLYPLAKNVVYVCEKKMKSTV